MHKTSKKVVVFDLDETIGHFEELGRFIDGLSALHENKQFIIHIIKTHLNILLKNILTKS